MSVPDKTAAAARPIRHAEPPRHLAARLHRARFGFARHALQIALLMLFYGTLHFGWTLFGAPVLTGNLSASELVGVLPLADPFAVLQMLVTRHGLATEVLLGAGLTLLLYLLLGGRVFCGWVCPMNLVTDAAGWLRARLGGRQTDLIRVPGATRYVLLLLALVVSALAGMPAFEAFSPIGMLHRELIYGAGLGLSAALGIFVLDALVLRHGWCGKLCPLGALWSLVGHAGQVKVAFDDASCTRCHDCVQVCPEPRVLNLHHVAERGMVASGECTSCGRCVAVCPEGSLRFDLRARCRPAAARDVFPSGGST